MAVKIVSDAGCDLDAETIRQLQIHIVPIAIRYADRELRDDQLELERFWQQFGDRLRFVHTAAPAPQTVRAIVKPLVEAGHDVLCLTITAQHSSTYDAFQAALAEFGDKVTLFDSKSFSLGEGLLTFIAAKMALDHLSLAEIVARLTALRRRLHLYILLTNIDQVKRGGRLSNVMPLVDRAAKIFRIKPIIEMVDGEFRFYSVVRSFQKGIAQISTLAAGHFPASHLAIAHTRCPNDAQLLLREIKQKVSALPSTLLFSEAGPTFAVHAGRHGLGVMVISNE